MSVDANASLEGCGHAGAASQRMVDQSGNIGHFNGVVFQLQKEKKLVSTILPAGKSGHHDLNHHPNLNHHRNPLIASHEAME
ncbi:hypothetical protein JXA32_12805 [Candidatus Sumerlaeota bacterium]|nr:hypothetical protein [Candidatus Sumerlaeota bacterium]